MIKTETLKQIISDIDFDKPDFTEILPYLTAEAEVDLGDLNGNLIGKFNAIKTLWEINKPLQPKSRSWIWSDPKGYQYFAVWQNAALFRILVRKFTLTLPLSGPLTQK